jgi:hypothetical protein
MLPAVPAALLAALCAASAQGERLAMLDPPDPLPFAAQALPPAPETVVLATRYYGSVTLDHQAHLARKIHCKACHGPGPVRKIAFTPKAAHERCRDCHVAGQRGPTGCRGCHAAQPQRALVADLAVPGLGGDRGAPAEAPPPAPPPGPGVLAALAAPEPSVPMRHAVYVSGAAGDGAGLSAQVVSRQAAFQVSHTVDLLVGGGARSRTALLVGAGVPVALPHALALTAEAVAGADAVERPGVRLSAALGGRLGLEWTPAWSRGTTLRASVTGLADLFRGGAASPACLYATLGMGTELRRPRRTRRRVSRGRGRPCRARSG